MKKWDSFLAVVSSKFSVLVPAIIVGLCNEASARDFFDPAFISSVGQKNTSAIPDLTIFSSRDAQSPGEYRVEILLNSDYKEIATILFVEKKVNNDQGKTVLVPCLSLERLKRYGLRISAFPGLKEDITGCTNTDIIPDFKSEFNFNKQQLSISIPQAALDNTAQGYIPAEEFDEGINALFANYQFNGSKDFQIENENYGLNLQSGLNVGAWRLRNLSTWNKTNTDNGKWDSVYLYAQRNIVPLNSTLVVGESSSLSSIFDSVPFTGVQLATDVDMLPDSLRGYAPVVRGIAKTNARVVIKQNGYQIYQAFVAPGAFEITDIYATGGNGDLYVTIEESDGTKQNYIVPYASLPLMLRQGQTEYEITSGKYRSYNNNTDETPFTQATISRGVLSNMTLYSGLQAASKYQALAFGIGHNLGSLGALSADITQAWSKIKNEGKKSGQSWRLRYGKNILETGTNITVAGYRYSTKGFNTLTDVLESYNNDVGTYSPRSLRNRTNLTVNQNIGDGLGSISVSALFEDYWDSKRRNKSLSIGYNGGWGRINYYLGYNYSRYTWKNSNSDRAKEDDHLFSLSISVPLSQWLPNAYASYQVNNSNPGSTEHYVSLSGVALENNNLDWNVQQGYSNRDSTSGGVYGTYRGSQGTATGNYSYNKHSQLINYGLSGSIMAHADGITLGQEMSDTAGLIKAPGLSGVRIENDQTIETDYRGYAIYPYLSPYRRNTLTLDSTTLGDEMELPETSKKSVPTRGAITRLNFKGNIGRRAFIKLLTSNGNAVPFGATVVPASKLDAPASIVSDGGMVYLSGLQDSGELAVQWGKNSDQQCKATYNLSDTNEQLRQTTAVCR
ncbi:fimbrial biogenesis outer membrane usher protein [Leclercia adecarboxylata]|nr:fimbria/pilus outer membrane usher protein [Leclercia adecarboxylata]MEB6379560.1 fimbrial biogenesis outer membrane usher protein [Leclercia adecarboxylata]